MIVILIGDPINTLDTNKYIKNYEFVGKSYKNIIIIGAIGSGKSYWELKHVTHVSS